MVGNFFPSLCSAVVLAPCSCIASNTNNNYFNVSQYAGAANETVLLSVAHGTNHASSLLSTSRELFACSGA